MSTDGMVLDPGMNGELTVDGFKRKLWDVPTSISLIKVCAQEIAREVTCLQPIERDKGELTVRTEEDDDDYKGKLNVRPYLIGGR